MPRSGAPAWWAGTFAALLIALLSGCATPAFDSSDYQDKVSATAKAMISSINTATLATHAWQGHRVTGPFADTVVSNAEDTAGSIAAVFDSRQPPDESSIHLKRTIDAPLQSTTSALTDLRIALRRGDHANVSKALKDLDEPLRQLDELKDSMP